MGYTKKQCRDQKKSHFDRKIAARNAPKRSKAMQTVVVKVIWTTPTGEQHLDYELITVPRSTTLKRLQQQIQGEKEEHVKDEHAGWTVAVEAFDTEHMPDNVLFDGKKLRFA